MTTNRIPGEGEAIRKITSSSSSGTSRFEEEGGNGFSSFLQNTENSVTTNTITPMDLPQLMTAGPSDPRSFLSQLQQAEQNALHIKEHLTNPEVKKWNSAQQKQLKTKLLSANENLKSAYVKLGGRQETENKAIEEQEEGEGGPIAKFLGYLTDGMNQLESVKHQVKSVSKDGMLAPADFLLIQLKLSKAQQELEFSGVLLSKVIDGAKQIMNVQI